MTRRIGPAVFDVRVILATVLASALILMGRCPATAQPAGPRSVPEPATQPTTAPQSKVKAGAIEGLTIRPEAGYVDVKAWLIRRDAKWLELLATTPGMREHESLLTIQPEPRQIHMGLLMLGLEPGRPVDVKRQGEKWLRVPPRGAPVRIELIYQHKGEQHTVPANEWIRNRQTGETLPHNRWLFTGSRLATFEGERFYVADRSGSVITLVGFGDDMLARDTSMTNRTDAQQLAANTPRLPPKGTQVTIRLRPAEPQPKPPATQPTPPATQPTR